MHFWINGIEFVLGESTLQDMIDSGVVPFRESDLEDAKNNLKKNTQSCGFRIDLDKYWSAQVYVLNDTDAGKPANECYISEIYLPNHPGETQDILKFDFPLTLTMDELKANAGEPEADNYKHYDGDNGYYTDTFKYTKPSTKYIGNSYYSFEYTKVCYLSFFALIRYIVFAQPLSAYQTRISNQYEQMQSYSEEILPRSERN